MHSDQKWKVLQRYFHSKSQGSKRVSTGSCNARKVGQRSLWIFNKSWGCWPYYKKLRIRRMATKFLLKLPFFIIWHSLLRGHRISFLANVWLKNQKIRLQVSSYEHTNDLTLYCSCQVLFSPENCILITQYTVGFNQKRCVKLKMSDPVLHRTLYYRSKLVNSNVFTFPTTFVRQAKL